MSSDVAGTTTRASRYQRTGTLQATALRSRRREAARPSVSVVMTTAGSSSPTRVLATMNGWRGSSNP